MQDSTEPARPDRRWVVLLIVTDFIQMACALLAPHFAYPCHRPQWAAWGIILIPVLWSLILLVIRRGPAERAVAYCAFLVAVTIAFLGIRFSL